MYDNESTCTQQQSGRQMYSVYITASKDSVMKGGSDVRHWLLQF